ncbi:hypothetical protein JCM9957A_38170 [Kineosporia succinea]
MCARRPSFVGGYVVGLVQPTTCVGLGRVQADTGQEPPTADLSELTATDALLDRLAARDASEQNLLDPSRVQAALASSRAWLRLARAQARPGSGSAGLRLGRAQARPGSGSPGLRLARAQARAASRWSTPIATSVGEYPFTANSNTVLLSS